MSTTPGLRLFGPAGLRRGGWTPECLTGGWSPDMVSPGVLGAVWATTSWSQLILEGKSQMFPLVQNCVPGGQSFT